MSQTLQRRQARALRDERMAVIRSSREPMKMVEITNVDMLLVIRDTFRELFTAKPLPPRLAYSA